MEVGILLMGCILSPMASHLGGSCGEVVLSTEPIAVILLFDLGDILIEL